MNRLFVFVSVVSLFVMQFCAVALDSNKALWTKTFAKEDAIERAQISDDARFIILGFAFQMNCVNVSDGKVLWSKQYKEDYSGKHDIVTWVDNNTVIVPTDKTIDWVDASSGKILGSVPALGESLGNLVYNGASVRYGFAKVTTTRYGNVLFVPFTNGYYLLDIFNKKIIYTSNEPPTKMFVEHWGNTVFFYSESMKKAVVFNSIERRVIYEHSTESAEIESDLFHHIIAHGNALTIFLADKILCIDYNKGSLAGVIDQDVSSIVNYTPVILGDRLFLLIQNSEKILCYDAQTAKELWSKKSADNYTDLMYAYTVNDSQILMATTNSYQIMALELIDGISGNVVWRRDVAEVKDKYKSGILYTERVVFETRNTREYSTRGLGGYRLDSVGVQTYFSQTGYDSTSSWNSQIRNNLFSTQCIRMEEAASGKVILLNENTNTIVVAVTGKNIRSAWGAEVERSKDGEGVLVLDKATGSVVRSTRVPFLRDFDMHSSILFVPWFVNGVEPIRYQGGTALLGTHTFAFVSDSGFVDTLEFNSKLLLWRDRGADYITFTSQSDDDEYADWKVTFGNKRLNRMLLSYTQEKKRFAFLPDTTVAEISLRYDDSEDALYAYDKLSEVPQNWPQHKWVLKEEDIEKLNLGNFSPDNDNSIGGIQQFENKTMIFGETAFVIINNQTGCVESITWKGEDDKSATKNVGFYSFGNSFLFDLDGDVGVGKYSGDCKTEMLGRTQKESEQVLVFFNPHFKTVVVMDVQSNRVDLYKL